MGLLGQNAVPGLRKYMTPERSLLFSALGTGLGQLGRGDPVTMGPAYQQLQQRQQNAAQRKQWTSSGVMDMFTPQERKMLASVPFDVAQSVIAKRAFAPKPGPQKGVAVGGSLVNPITGEVIYQGQPKPTDTLTSGIKEYQYAQAHDGYQGTFEQFKTEMAKAGRSSVTVNNGRNLKIPAGYMPVDPNNPRSGVTPIPGSTQDKAVRETANTLKTSQAKANDAISVIDQALASPGLNGAVGLVQGHLPAYNNATADFLALHQQIQGKTFMQAYRSLKGGGQITEVEGAKAEAAIARLTRVQSEASYRQALKDLKEVIIAGRDRAHKAAISATQKGQPNVPTGQNEFTWNPVTGGLDP